MKVSIVYPAARRADVALGFNSPEDYNFIFQGKDKKNIQNLVNWVQEKGFEIYLTGDLAEEVLGNHKSFSQGQYPLTINLGAVGKDYSALSNEVESLLDQERNITGLSKKLFGQNFIGTDPTIRSRIGENKPVYSYLFSWKKDGCSGIRLGIYDELTQKE
jgi:hypothetical protein